MSFWRIERGSDGFVAVVEAASRELAEKQFEDEYGFGGEDGQVDESTAEEYAEFRRDRDNDIPWYS